MANTSSAKKAQRVAERRRVFNARRKKAMKEGVKDVARLISAKKASEAAASLPSVFQAIDKAAKDNVINKGAAARMKSRISKRIRALSV